MALDEHRKPFSPTLWHFLESDRTSTPASSSANLREAWKKLHKDDRATDGQLDKAWNDLVDAEMHEELKGHRPTLLQVWFPGVHINIGGGSDEMLTKKRDDFERRPKPVVSICFEFYRLALEMNFTLTNSQRSPWSRSVGWLSSYGTISPSNPVSIPSWYGIDSS